MVIELQKEDIFSNLSSYLFARKYVQDRGYRVCLDGMALGSLRLIKRKRLDIGMTKLIWSPDLVDGGDEVHAMIAAMVKEDGEGRIVLIRCDNREAIDFGKSIGIQLFQGRFVENLIAEDNRRREMLRLKPRIEQS